MKAARHSAEVAGESFGSHPQLVASGKARVVQPEHKGCASLEGRDHMLWVVAFALTAFGLLMIYSVSTAQGFFSQSSLAVGRLRDQGLAFGIGSLALLVCSRLDYRRLRRPIVAGFLVSLLLVVATRIPHLGVAGNGATRWLALGPVTLQPSEIAKIAYVCMAAHLLTTPRVLNEEGSCRKLLIPLAPLAAAGGFLILLQPDLGTALIIALVVLGMWWQAGMPLRYWFGAAALSVLVVALAIWGSDYRRARFLTFLDPFKDPQGTGFQTIQSFLALARGGWWGVGPGRSIQKFNYLPEAHTDMIFSIVAEEFGFVGVGLLILAFGILILSIFRVAIRCHDPFGRLLAGGIGLMIGVQTVINLGGVTGMLPLTGVPLPFVSYGRTNLVVMFAGLGLVLAVARFGFSSLGGVPESSCPRSSHVMKDSDNVTYLDIRRRYRRPRSSGSGNR